MILVAVIGLAVIACLMIVCCGVVCLRRSVNLLTFRRLKSVWHLFVIYYGCCDECYNFIFQRLSSALNGNAINDEQVLNLFNNRYKTTAKLKTQSRRDSKDVQVQPNFLLQTSETSTTKQLPLDWNRQPNPAGVDGAEYLTYNGTSESARRNGSAVRSSKPDNVEYFVLDGEVVSKEMLVETIPV